MIFKKIITMFVVVLPFIFNVCYAENLSKQQGDAILQELQKIRILLENIDKRELTQGAAKPSAAIVKVSTEGASIIGKITAPLTLVEYTDYQCPYCYKFFKDTYPQLKLEYIDTGKLRLIIKDLPLSFHPHARKAAQAARCAGDQGKFLEMFDILHKNSQRLDEKYLSSYAKSILLDVKVFNRCLGSSRHLATIDRGTAEASKIKISGTPTFVLGKTERDFVVGKKIVGAKSMLDFERYIIELVASLRSKNTN